MSITRLSWMSILSIAFITLFSCQKDLSEPTITSNAGKGGGGGTPTTPTLFYLASSISSTPSPLEVGGTINVSSDVLKINNEGAVNPNANSTITITVTYRSSDGLINEIINQDGTTSSNTFSWRQSGATSTGGAISFLALRPGCYTVLVGYAHNPSDMAFPVNSATYTETICTTSGDEDPTTCSGSGVSLTTKLVLVALDENFKPNGKFAVEFIVNNCIGYTGDYKLQGGLTSGTILTASGTGPYIGMTGVPGTLRKATGNLTNSSINWVNNPALVNGDNYFWVEFTKTISWQTDAATGQQFDYLTGSWSIKTPTGIEEYAPRVILVK